MQGIPLSKTPTYIRLDFPEHRDAALQEIDGLLQSLPPGEVRHIQISMEGCVIGGFDLLVETTSATRITGTGQAEQEDPEFYEDRPLVLEKRGDEWYAIKGVTEYGTKCDPKHIVYVYAPEEGSDV